MNLHDIFTYLLCLISAMSRLAKFVLTKFLKKLREDRGRKNKSNTGINNNMI